jgi:hypothetical protein
MQAMNIKKPIIPPLLLTYLEGIDHGFHYGLQRIVKEQGHYILG